MTDEELIARACEVGAALLRRPGDLDRLAARPAPVPGDGGLPGEEE